MLQSFTNAQRLIAEGIDPSKSLIEVAPSAHFCCGGILIDSQCFTGIEGLWAVGEVTGGIHGGNRLGANALTEILVFGRIAGENAALWAKNCPPSRVAVEYTSKKLEKTDDNSISEKLSEFEIKIKNIIWQSAGISRHETTLKNGLDLITEINNELKGLGSRECLGKAFPLWSRLVKMSLLGKVILVAALRREESRGAHFRSDYPRKFSDFNHSIKVTLGEDRLLKICNCKRKGDKDEC
jgi:aspartate oxidase